MLIEAKKAQSGTRKCLLCRCRAAPLHFPARRQVCRCPAGLENCFVCASNLAFQWTAKVDLGALYVQPPSPSAKKAYGSQALCSDHALGGAYQVSTHSVRGLYRDEPGAIPFNYCMQGKATSRRLPRDQGTVHLDSSSFCQHICYLSGFHQYDEDTWAIASPVVCPTQQSGLVLKKIFYCGL